MEFEQLSFEMDFEAGELKAPVSSLYKKFIYENLKYCVDVKDENYHFIQVYHMKQMFMKNELFKKTSKKFQKEVYDLLEIPFESLYEQMKGEPLKKPEETVPQRQLKLVK